VAQPTLPFRPEGEKRGPRSPLTCGGSPADSVRPAASGRGPSPGGGGPDLGYQEARGSQTAAGDDGANQQRRKLVGGSGPHVIDGGLRVERFHGLRRCSWTRLGGRRSTVESR
jgi:hypothetical protein